VSALPRRGTNFPAVGEYNQAAVLDAIRRQADGASRTDISHATGLSLQTVSNVTRRLIDSGIVRETGTRTRGAGKPPLILELVPDSYFAVGVHLDPSVLTCVVIELNTRIVAHRSEAVADFDAPESLIAAIASLAERVIADAGVDRSRILGLGIASPGPIDTAAGEVLNPPNLSGWDRVTLRSDLIELTKLPVLVERDVTAAVVAELWTRTNDTADDFVFFYYGTGLNAGVAIGRDVLRGVNGRGGAAAHIYTGPDGEPCTCGRTGCLGVTCEPRTLVRKAHEIGILPMQPPHAGSEGSALIADMRSLADKAASGDDAACGLFTDTGTRIGRGISTMLGVFDINRVVFGGPFWQLASGALRVPISEFLADDRSLVDSTKIEMRDAAVGEDVAAIGAACLVLDHVFAPRPSSMLLS
jgi:predicted NBD/HSP70 family sugar kinase